MHEPQKQTSAAEDVGDLVEQLVARLPILREGERTLQLHFSNGHYRRGDVHLGPLKLDELRGLAK
jgi:hypothetical protein